MDYLIRFTQTYESFRKPELEALAHYENVAIEILDYRPDSPFCVVRFHWSTGCVRRMEDVAKSFISRSILSRGIYELWGQGVTYDLLHENVKARSSHLWEQHRHASFRFSLDSFCGKNSVAQKKEIINSFRYFAWEGKISMKDPEVEVVIFEEFEEAKKLTHDQMRLKKAEERERIGPRQPKRLFFGRFLGGTQRDLIEKHDLKKRPYISTTSMDAELALLTATFALAAPGRIFLDPFVGTGGFMVAASELGALTLGSDIDGRSFRGKGSRLSKGIGANFKKYGLESLFGDCFTGDLVNTPFRSQGTRVVKPNRWLDGIISDPPYGVREGLKVLGTRPGKIPIIASDAEDGNTSDRAPPLSVQPPHYIGGILAHTLPDYVAPKKPYSLVRMLDDILNFAAGTLVDGGRLAFWMPNANELDQELIRPTHALLELKHVSVQSFGKWSRSLLVYERVKGDAVGPVEAVLNGSDVGLLNLGSSADDLNPFRKMYFEGFQTK